jgi:DNA-binding MarR family transcriptional regulator
MLAMRPLHEEHHDSKAFSRDPRYLEVGLSDRLAMLGLVHREPAHADRRQVYVQLTPRGTEILEQLAAAHRDELYRLRPQLHALLERLAGEAQEGMP